ncbi:hypothetical protein OROHE_000295 [Orobanche hederae]
MEWIQTENDDIAATEHVVSRIQQSGLFNLGRQQSELYDESVVEEFYQEASVRFCSDKKGGDVAEISATICGVEIRINCHLLEDLFSLPSYGLKMEELESFGTEDLMSSFWCVFIGDIADKKVRTSCAFEMCTNLRFRMMMEIMFGEPVNWCQIILKRLQEEVSKPLSQKKSFGLLLKKNIFSCLDVPFAMNAKKIGPGKFIGERKSTSFNRDVIPVDSPSVFELPHSANLRDVTKKSKASKPTEVTDTPVEAQTEENVEVAPPTALNLQGTDESSAFPESVVTAPVRVSTPVQDPSPQREPSPVRDPSPLRAPTPVRIPSLEQASIPVTDPKPTEIPIPVRSHSATQSINDILLSVQIEQAFERFVQWKSYRVAVYDLLYHWEDWEKEKFILEITDTMDISLLIRWENNFCHELITNFYITQAETRLKAKPNPLIMLQVARPTTHTTMTTPSRQDPVLLPDQVEAERQQEDSVPPVSSSTENQVPEVTAPQDETIQQPAVEPLIDAPASPSSQHMVEIIPLDRPMRPTPRAALLMLTGPKDPVARPDSPRFEVRKNRLDALGRHTVFIQDAVSALHKVGKALDKLNVSAAEEIGGVTSNLFNIANALQFLAQLLKVALANIQQQNKDILEKDQAKYSTFAARTSIALKA